MESLSMAPWLIAAIALLAAFVLGLRLRRSVEVRAEQEAAAEALESECGALRAQLDKALAKRRRQAEELAELRKRFDKLKRRSGRTRDAGAEPAAALRAAERGEQIETARRERDTAREELKALAAELERLRAERSAAERAVQRAAEVPDPTAELEKRAERAEARLRQREADLAEARQAVERVRGRLRTQDSLYVAIRGELAAKKDRLRTQQEELERLRALKVAVVDPLPELGASQPQALRIGPQALSGPQALAEPQALSGPQALSEPQTVAAGEVEAVAEVLEASGLGGDATPDHV